MTNFKIDLVYLWVDGNDPKWLAKKNQFLGKIVDLHNEATTKARYADNGELRYSLRSVERNAPWIRRIFIVTDDQTPDWLDLQNDRVQIIDHRQILPPESLPCYNTGVMDHFLWKIPGLSEHFLFANDDTFFNRLVSPDFFFTAGGLPVIRLQRVHFGKLKYWVKKALHIPTSIYRKKIHHSASLMEQKFGRYFSYTPHHNVDAYLKSEYQHVAENVFGEEISRTLTHHTRTENDIQRIIYNYYALHKKRGQLRFVGRNESCRIRMHNPDFSLFIRKYQPALFCLNDSHRATDKDRERVEPFLQELFPEKSSFEK